MFHNLFRVEGSFDNCCIYQSYQFEDGSDSETLVLEVNAGDVSGIKEFTIDEIKYVEIDESQYSSFLNQNSTIQLSSMSTSGPTFYWSTVL